MPYGPISEINFKSARKLKEDLDHAINSNSRALVHSTGQYILTVTETFLGFLHLWKKRKTLMENVKKGKVKHVALSLKHSYADQFILKSWNIPTVPDDIYY